VKHFKYEDKNVPIRCAFVALHTVAAFVALHTVAAFVALHTVAASGPTMAATIPWGKEQRKNICDLFTQSLGNCSN